MRFVLTEKVVRNTVKTLLVAVTLLAVGVATYDMRPRQNLIEPFQYLIEAVLWILFQTLPPALYWLLFRRIIQACSSEWQRLGMLIISALLIGFYSIGYLDWIGSTDPKRGLVFFMWPILALLPVGFIAAVYFVLSKFRNL